MPINTNLPSKSGYSSEYADEHGHCVSQSMVRRVLNGPDDVQPIFALKHRSGVSAWFFQLKVNVLKLCGFLGLRYEGSFPTEQSRLDEKYDECMALCSALKAAFIQEQHGHASALKNDQCNKQKEIIGTRAGSLKLSYHPPFEPEQRDAYYTLALYSGTNSIDKEIKIQVNELGNLIEKCDDLENYGKITIKSIEEGKDLGSKAPDFAVLIHGTGGTKFTQSSTYQPVIKKLLGTANSANAGNIKYCLSLFDKKMKGKYEYNPKKTISIAEKKEAIEFFKKICYRDDVMFDIYRAENLPEPVTAKDFFSCIADKFSLNQIKYQFIKENVPCDEVEGPKGLREAERIAKAKNISSIINEKYIGKTVALAAYSAGFDVAMKVVKSCPETQFNLLLIDPVSGPIAKNTTNSRVLPRNVNFCRVYYGGRSDLTAIDGQRFFDRSILVTADSKTILSISYCGNDDHFIAHRHLTEETAIEFTKGIYPISNKSFFERKKNISSNKTSLPNCNVLQYMQNKRLSDEQRAIGLTAESMENTLRNEKERKPNGDLVSPPFYINGVAVKSQPKDQLYFDFQKAYIEKDGKEIPYSGLGPTRDEGENMVYHSGRKKYIFLDGNLFNLDETPYSGITPDLFTGETSDVEEIEWKDGRMYAVNFKNPRRRPA